MNLIIDSLHDQIRFYSPATKKEPSISFAMDFPYSLSSTDNQIKALTDFLKKEEVKPLVDSKTIDLLLPDNGIGFGTFDIPALSKRKALDVFDTRFKLSYPNFEEYCVFNEEYERNADGCLYFYTLVKKSRIDQISSMLKSQNLFISSISFFAAHLAKLSQTKVVYPKATLLIGKDHAEMIITKGKTVLFVYDFGCGFASLLQGEEFFDSAYHLSHERSSQFAGFAAKNFASKIPFTDENIGKTDPQSGFYISRPRGLRIMKGEVLANYVVKNNFRKFYALIGDVLAHYASAPWFLPLTEIEIYAPEEVVMGLEELGKADGIHFNANDEAAWNAILEHDIAGHRLFKSGIKKERRSFDWRKLLTMEIGKKKA